jgi:AraC-like DNA-binding protein
MQVTKEPLVRAAVLIGYPALAESLGIDPAAALRRAGVAREALTDPNHRIPVLQLNRLLKGTATVARAEAVGLRLARDISIERLGLLRLLLQHAATAGEAFAIVGRYSQLHNEALSLWTERDGSYLSVRHEYLTRSPGSVREIVEMTAGVIVLNLRVVIGNDWTPLRVCFRHAAPTDARFHRQVFGCPIQFAADFDGLVCPATDFARRNRLAGADSTDLVRELRALAVREAGDTTLLRARRLIWALLPSERCTAAEVARLLGIDRRTLHRHLARHGESFSTLHSAVRVELAARHVRLGLRRLADVADLLGFRSQSDFSHWFKTHFHASPREWRDRFPENGLPHRRGRIRKASVNRAQIERRVLRASG